MRGVGLRCSNEPRTTVHNYISKLPYQNYRINPLLEFACNSNAIRISSSFCTFGAEFIAMYCFPLPITVYLCCSHVCMKLNLPILLPSPFVSIAPPC